MEIGSVEELTERVDELIEFLTEHEDTLYVALEVAHQLRDEVVQVVTSCADE